MDIGTAASLVAGAALALVGGGLQRRWEDRRQLRQRLHFEVMTVLLDYTPHYLMNRPQGPEVVALKDLYRSAVLLGRQERTLVNALRAKVTEWPWAFAKDQPDVTAEELNRAGDDWNRDVASLLRQIADAIERRLTWRFWRRD